MGQAHGSDDQAEPLEQTPVAPTNGGTGHRLAVDNLSDISRLLMTSDISRRVPALKGYKDSWVQIKNARQRVEHEMVHFSAELWLNDYDGPGCHKICKIEYNLDRRLANKENVLWARDSAYSEVLKDYGLDWNGATEQADAGLPPGSIFIDAAVFQVQLRLRLPEVRTAAGFLLSALRNERVASVRMGHWLTSSNNIRSQLTGADWHSAELSAPDSGGIGVRFKGRTSNLHHFAINEADFRAWLDGLDPVEPSKPDDRGSALDIDGIPPSIAPQAHPAPIKLRKAGDAQIETVITGIYAHAKNEGMKPPNIKELPQHVVAVLAEKGLAATKVRIASLADGEKYKAERGKSGARTSLPAFSLEGCKKSRLEI